MKLTDYISRVFTRRNNILVDNTITPFGFGEITKYEFGRLIFLNICELITDLANDVTLVNNGNYSLRFEQFNAFFDAWGAIVMTKLYEDGFVVIGEREGIGFRILSTNDYQVLSKVDVSEVKPLDPTVKVYVMRSPTWIARGVSDKTLCMPFIEYIDNVLNASNTACARLGNLIVASPKNVNNAPTATVLTEEQKCKLEDQLKKEYGALADQKQIMLLPREMSFQVVSLASVDIKTPDKVKLGILAIVDRIKAPANQVAIVDAMSSKSLSNGTELREGDFNKYQTFERAFSRSWLQMATDIGLSVGYTIYNKPTRVIQ